MTEPERPTSQRVSTRWRTIGAVVLAALGIVVWVSAYFVPQQNRLGELSSERSSLGQVLGRERVALRALREELRRAPGAVAVERRAEMLVPASADLAGYTQLFTAATNAAGVMITSFEPGLAVRVRGTPFDTTPLTVTIKGAYDHILKFVESIAHFTRLTVLNGLSIRGGGPRTTRASLLVSVMKLAIFYDAKIGAGGSRAASLPPGRTVSPTPSIPECGASRDPFDPTGAPPPSGSPARC